MKFETLLFQVKNSVAHLTLNRPASRNAVTAQMCEDLMKASLICDEDPEIRAVLMSGAGGFFCVGGDINFFESSGPELSRVMKEWATYLHNALVQFAQMEAPLITAVTGFAAGAGLSLAASGDLVLAGESAQFTMSYTKIGISPDGGSTFFLPRAIGMKRTLDLAITNRVLTAAEAEAWGLVTRVIPDDSLMAEAVKLAERVAKGPTRAYGAVKRLVYGSFERSQETQMELEKRFIATTSTSADGQEGIRAFLEKRKPNFKGR